MFTLKKSLLLIFFLGMVSLSLCKPVSDADEEPSNGPSEDETTAENGEIGEDTIGSIIKRRVCSAIPLPICH
uniref:Tigerinin cDNA n=1 Tax=Hoplobatrachus rugulosus TaxID=110072 RepID=A0A2P9DTW0_HOPRU|nr:Tigerinin precursor cDNA [Hoplobatrachus rugulosus]